MRKFDPALDLQYSALLLLTPTLDNTVLISSHEILVMSDYAFCV